MLMKARKMLLTKKKYLIEESKINIFFEKIADDLLMVSLTNQTENPMEYGRREKLYL